MNGCGSTLGRTVSLGAGAASQGAVASTSAA